MLTCTNCGASVRDEARFCTSCGTRLNPPADANATAVWPTPTEGDDSPPATEVDEQSDENGDEVQMPHDEDTAPSNDADNDDDDGFSWSWRSSGSEETTVLDEESGAVTTPEEGPIDDPAPDFTELEILDESPTAESAGEDGPRDDPAPDTSDAELVIDDDQSDDDQSDDEATEATLAGFASTWESSSPIPLGSSDSDVDEQETPEPPAEALSTSDGDSKESEDDDEDTVSKAERLIGELRSIIPALARPMPARPAENFRGQELADALDEARRTDDWDDVREALVASQQNPRDIDNMIALSGKIDRILALLEDRDRLAQAAESVAERLRQSDSTTSEM